MTEFSQVARKVLVSLEQHKIELPVCRELLDLVRGLILQTGQHAAQMARDEDVDIFNRRLQTRAITALTMQIDIEKSLVGLVPRVLEHLEACWRIMNLQCAKVQEFRVRGSYWLGVSRFCLDIANFPQGTEQGNEQDKEQDKGDGERDACCNAEMVNRFVEAVFDPSRAS